MSPLLAALALGTVVSEDLTCLSAGMLVASGHLPFPAALAACLLGITIGDAFMFAAGHWLGRPFLRKRPICWLLREQTVDIAACWLRRNAVGTLVASRVLPGARLPAFVALGLAGAADARIVRWYALLTLAWTPLLVAAGAIAGAVLFRAAQEWQAIRIWMLLFPLLAVWLIGRLATAIIRRRGLVAVDRPSVPPADDRSPP
jgi:membrane protein DedA with SNARE-associated domain